MPTKLEIKNKYQHLSVSQWGLYLPINFAFDFLYECDANDLLVIGIECFIHHGNGVVEA